MAGLVLCVLAMAGLATGANAQAFGIRMGDRVETHGVKVVQSPTRAVLETVPVPHPEFEGYVALHAPNAGVCQVVGVGVDHTQDATGESVRASYDRLKADLAARYGPGDASERLAEGAMWDGEREWAISLAREREHATAWSQKAGGRLPPDVSDVQLAVKATDPSTTYLQLTYRFRNLAECERARDAEAAQAFASETFATEREVADWERRNVKTDGWVRIVWSKDAVFYSTPASWEVASPGTVRLWIRTERLAPDTDGELSAHTLYEFDCENQRLRLLAMDWYEGRNLTGRRIGSQKDPEADWHFPGPGTAGAFLREAICAIAE